MIKQLKTMNMEVLNCCVGFKKFIERSHVSHTESYNALHDEMIELVGGLENVRSDFVIFDAITDQPCIVVIKGKKEDDIFKCKAFIGSFVDMDIPQHLCDCVEPTFDEDVDPTAKTQVVKKPFEDTEFEEEEDGVPQVDEIEHEA